MPKYLIQVSWTHDAVKDFAKDRGSKRRQAADHCVPTGVGCRLYLHYGTVGVPAATSTEARGINDSAQIVGDFRDSSFQTHGFLKSGAAFITIDVPGATLTEAFGINDSGQIVGGFRDSLGTHGFLATPVPEPGALVLLAAGLMGRGMAARKRPGKSFL